MVDHERDEIINGLPRRSASFYPTDHEPNAWVYMDSLGRVAILLKDGGWLGCKPNEMVGDIAPFSD